MHQQLDPIPAPPPAKPRPTRAGARATRLPNTPPDQDPYKVSLQHRCHQLYVIEGRSYTSIAGELGIERQTVSAYVRMESDRRAAERAENRNVEIDRSVAIYNDVGRHYSEKMRAPGARGDEGRYVMEARDKIDGLLALKTPPAEESTSATALVGVQHDSVLQLLTLALTVKP